MTRSIARSVVVLLSLSGVCAAAPPLAPQVAEGDPPPVELRDSAGPDLTAAQQKTVLRLLNNICGDTWCDGDWAFDFKKLTCNLAAGTCTWTTLVQPSVPVASPVPVYWRSCKVSGVHSFSDLVDTFASGYQALTSTYYAASTRCVWEIEPKLPPYTPL